MICKSIQFIILSLILLSCSYNNKEDLFKEVEQKDLTNCDSINYSYENYVKPILAKNCYACHGANSISTRLIEYNQVLTLVNNGKLLGSIKKLPGYNPMPQNKSLSECDIKTIELWIIDGAIEN